MSEKERNAVENVVRGRQPVLVPLPVELREEEADDPEEGEAGEGSQAGNILEPQVVVTIDEEEGVSPPRVTPPRKKCPGCSKSFKLQIQLNRHKEHCVKSEVVEQKYHHNVHRHNDNNKYD